MKKLFSVIDEVEKFLTKYPVLRDNDEKLMANTWGIYIGEKDLNDMSAEDLLSALSHGTLPSYESISRCRRKLQGEPMNWHLKTPLYSSKLPEGEIRMVNLQFLL